MSRFSLVVSHTHPSLLTHTPTGVSHWYCSKTANETWPWSLWRFSSFPLALREKEHSQSKRWYKHGRGFPAGKRKTDPVSWLFDRHRNLRHSCVRVCWRNGGIQDYLFTSAAVNKCFFGRATFLTLSLLQKGRQHSSGVCQNAEKWLCEGKTMVCKPSFYLSSLFFWIHRAEKGSEAQFRF